MSYYWRFARDMLREHRLGFGLALVFAFISAGGLGAGIVSVAPLFTLLLRPDDPQSLATLAAAYNAEPGNIIGIPAAIVSRLPVTPEASVRTVIGVLIALTILGAAANFLHQFLSQTITTRAIARVRTDGFERALALPLTEVLARGTSSFVSRLVRDAAELQRGLIALVSKSVSQITKGLAAFVAALFFDWQLTLAAVIVLPLLAITLRKVGKRIRRGTRDSLQAQEGLLRIASERVQGLRAVKANSAEHAAVRDFERENADVVRHELRIRTARALSSPLLELLAVFAIGGLALVAAGSILSGRLSPEDFVLTLGALGVAGGSFRPLAGLVNEIQASAAPARRLADLLDTPPESPAPDRRPDLVRHARDIRFDGVTVRYPGANRPALAGIDLTIEHGQRVALVGPNGSGKTTLVSLLPRLIVPEAGRVLVDGTDLAAASLFSVRRQVGVVTQETVLFGGTIAENIRFGRDDVSDDAVRAAATQARALEFIEALPGGFDAVLSEQGGGLSGGQRQRLAIARVILRDPSIVVLDEATSQVDAESEQLIATALAEFCAGRTSFIVAHRLATVVDADRIIVMEDGAIVDDGLHAELLQRCALYRRLTETQLIPA